MAHSSSDGHVGYTVWPQRLDSRKNPGTPPQCLMCPEVAISQRMHLWEGKSASNQPCESSNASPGRCGQEPWASVALWGKAEAVTSRTFVGHVCPAVGCPGRNSRRPGLGWCPRSIGERRGLFPLSYTIEQSRVVGCCPGVQAPTVRRCLVVTPVDVLAVEVTNIQTGVWERRDGRWCESPTWRFVDVNDFESCNVYAQPLMSDCSGDWSTSDHSNRSWTNVARPWFLLRTDPASEKLGITSLSAVVQWVSRRTMMKALFL